MVSVEGSSIESRPTFCALNLARNLQKNDAYVTKNAKNDDDAKVANVVDNPTAMTITKPKKSRKIRKKPKSWEKLKWELLQTRAATHRDIRDIRDWR